MFKFLDNVCVTLTSAIDRSTNILPISGAEKSMLVDILGVNGYSYLTLSASLGTEIIKISVANGSIAMSRGQGGSEPVSSSAGRCLCFRFNKLILDEYVKNIQEPCKLSIISDDLEIIEPAEDECEWKINLKEDFKDRLEICCPSGDCPQCNVVDGTYENATVTIRNGKICEISNGRNIVYTGGSCCGCTNCDENNT